MIYIDPYLSNSVQELDGPDLKRLIPIPVSPESILDANWVLITHDHIDHCDPQSLPMIARASTQCKFVGPESVLKKLEEWGISTTRLQLARENWRSIGPDVKLLAIPAAHPSIERYPNGNLHFLGYLLEIKGKRIYFSGDTGVTQELIDTLIKLKPISVAVLPVNEQNFFRLRRGIIGNMSIREAFLFAEEISIDSLIPVHWDMFSVNEVDPDEIQAVYKQMSPSFDLLMQPSSIEL